jgi:chemotaxis protein methyltransferase CheR
MHSYPLSDTEFAAVQALALRLAGITLPSSKKALVIGRWSRRLSHHGLNTFAEYLALLSGRSGGEELQTALDLLTTNETHFFREQGHFDFLREKVLPNVRRGATFRVWSAACSSGEEVYSVAMLLADVLGPTRWEVLGSDISSRVLNAARNAQYEMERARSIPPDYLKRFCLKGVGPQAGTFLIDRPLCERVQLRQLNLNEPLPNVGEFDVILLRNVMIYFNASTKASVVARLLPVLKSGGHFLVGHCETLNGVTSELDAVSASIYTKSARVQ